MLVLGVKGLTAGSRPSTAACKTSLRLLFSSRARSRVCVSPCSPFPGTVAYRAIGSHWKVIEP